MITKKDIRRYLYELCSDTVYEQGEMPAHVWRQFCEYIVNHYKRLDKEARAYADEILDQLELSIERRIDLLPEGREKKTLSRKLSIIRGKRPPVSVLYLDTPLIENIIRHALGQRLAGPIGPNFKALYEEVMTLVKDGKLIFPEDSFHRQALQMGGPQAREGLNIIRTLSGGLSFKHSQSIEDSQVFRALRGFIDGNRPVNYRDFWQDAFDKETVNAIMKKRPSILFRGVLALAEKPGAAVSGQGGPGSISARLRIRYDEASLKDEQQLQQRSARHLRDLVRLGMKYQRGAGKAQKRHLDGFWAAQKTDLPLALWGHYGGRPEGLEGLASFYESEHFGSVPAIRIKREIWNALSANHTEGLGRVTGSADVIISSSVLPYTDIMILDRNMADVVRGRLRLDLEFDTEIYSVDEHDLIMNALKEIARSE
jgi:hypothetical protein